MGHLLAGGASKGDRCSGPSVLVLGSGLASLPSAQPERRWSHAGRSGEGQGGEAPSATGRAHPAPGTSCLGSRLPVQAGTAASGSSGLRAAGLLGGSYCCSLAADLLWGEKRSSNSLLGGQPPPRHMDRPLPRTPCKDPASAPKELLPLTGGKPRAGAEP